MKNDKKCRFNQKRNLCLKSGPCEPRCGRSLPIFCAIEPCIKEVARCGCPPNAPFKALGLTFSMKDNLLKHISLKNIIEKPLQDRLGRCHENQNCPSKRTLRRLRKSKASAPDSLDLRICQGNQIWSFCSEPVYCRSGWLNRLYKNDFLSHYTTFYSNTWKKEFNF